MPEKTSISGRRAATTSRPVFIRQRTTLRSLVDDWQEMTLDERKRLLLLVFKDVVVDGEGSLNSCRTMTGSRPWGALLTRKQGLPERKTRVRRAEVVTLRLVQDELGWLRLAC
jgi:hypothetical protein